MPRIIGDDLLARDERGKLRTKIATVFPRSDTIVTLPGIHASQRVAYTDELNRQRVAAGQPPLTEAEMEEEWSNAVDLVMDDENVLIRPDPKDMDLAFEADELLQEIISKQNIKFLHVLDPSVRDAIRRRGELWRISPLPRSPDEMKAMIDASRIGIGGREIYYYAKDTGTRLLTYDHFAALGNLPDDSLRAHLVEIQRHTQQKNRFGQPEVAFFAPDPQPIVDAMSEGDFAALEPGPLRMVYQRLVQIFAAAVPPELRHDDLNSPQWRAAIFAALIGKSDKTVSEEKLLGLSAEFFMQVEWLPGGRIDNGELILDPVFYEEGCAIGHRARDENARGFIINFLRDYTDLDYVNIGAVGGSMSGRPTSAGRRGVYLAEVQPKGGGRPILRIIRMQKWGVREHLDAHKDLLNAILEAEEYTEYVMDRRLGCRQLGMQVPPRLTARKISERYDGSNANYRGRWIWTSYFERDYIPGVASDKISAVRLADDRFALAFARIMGRAAAPNLVVGRCDLEGKVIFDDGDELIIEDERGIPLDAIVADHTGTFVDFRGDLRLLAPAYASPVNRRLECLPDVEAFTTAYVDEFCSRFSQIQQEYRRRKRAFDTLFRHMRHDEGGSFAFRWQMVLARLSAADPFELARIIRQSVKR
ncbi:MAG TPA: hypothetical protein VMD30_14135 [Tepidisphaeraceae bacterium]|nr:hypothetical protein [Tepidisphaeraceae bacterium]